MGTVALYPRQTKYLLANLELFSNGEGDEAMLPSFITENAAIGASSSSLEALFANRYMQMGCDGSSLPTANKRFVRQSLIAYK